MNGEVRGVILFLGEPLIVLEVSDRKKGVL